MKVVSKFSNISLRNKFLVIIISLFLFFVLTFIGVVNIIQENYNRVVYQKTDQLLTMLLGNVEKELIGVENFAFSLSSNTTLQENLQCLQDGSYPEYERSVAINTVNTILSNNKMWESNVNSITLHIQNLFISNGWNHTFLSQDEFVQVKNSLTGKNGKATWNVSDNEAKTVFLAKEILKISQLELSHLGYLFVKINLDTTVRSGIKSLAGFNYETYLEILQNDNVLFSSANTVLAQQTVMPIDSYTIIKSDNQTFLGVNKISAYNGWQYRIYIDITQQTNEIKQYCLKILWIALVVVFCVCILCVGYFSAQSRHLENLVNKINAYYRNDMKTTSNDTQYQNRTDEIGLLHQSFDKMTEDISIYIKENYEQNLLIKEAQIKILQNQINPHFLFNTLNTINWLSKNQENQKVSECITALSRLLRSSLVAGDSLISLQEELALVNDYLYIAKIRYGTRLLYEEEIQPQALQCAVPKMSLQGLVENCIKHALDNMIDSCTIKISVQIKQNNVEVTVSDNGPGFVQNQASSSTGVGLNNINNRTKLAFGEPYGLIINSSPQGTCITLTIPLNK